MRGKAVIIICLLSIDNLAFSQVTFDDVKSGYKENLTAVWGNGFRVQIRTNFQEREGPLRKHQIDHRLQWERRLLSKATPEQREKIESRIRELETDLNLPLRQYGFGFDVGATKDGFFVRKSLLNPRESIEEHGVNGPLFPKSLEPYVSGDGTGVFDTFFQQHGDENFVITRNMQRQGDILKSYVITRSDLASFIQPLVQRQGFIAYNPFNAPFVLEFDRECWAFMPITWVLFDWDNEHIVRRCEILDDGRIKLTLEESPHHPYSFFEDCFFGNFVEAIIDPAAGFLPVSIEFGGLLSIDGNLIRTTDKEWPYLCRAEFENVQLASGGFYPKSTTLRHFGYLYPWAPEEIGSPDSIEALKWSMEQLPPKKDDLIETSVLVIEVTEFEAWDNPENFNFRPKQIDGARFVDETTGETRYDQQSQEVLRLDLKHGDRPIHPDFSDTNTTADAAGSIFKYAFWVLVLAVGAWLVVKSRRSHST